MNPWKPLMLLAVLGLSLGVGYGVGRYRSPETSDAAGPTREEASKGAAPSAPGTPALTPHELAEVETVIDRLSLSPNEQALAQRLGSDALSVKLKRSILGGRHLNEIPEARALGQLYFKDFREQPAAGFEAIRRGLNEVTASEFPAERGALLIAAANLPGQEARVRELAFLEMTGNVPAARLDPRKARTEEELNRAASTTPAMVLPVAAHAAFIKTAADDRAALEGTVTGIQTQRDAGIQSTMAAQFIGRYPALEGALRARVALPPPPEALE